MMYQNWFGLNYCVMGVGVCQLYCCSDAIFTFIAPAVGILFVLVGGNSSRISPILIVIGKLPLCGWTIVVALSLISLGFMTRSRTRVRKPLLIWLRPVIAWTLMKFYVCTSRNRFLPWPGCPLTGCGRGEFQTSRFRIQVFVLCFYALIAFLWMSFYAILLSIV